MASLTWQRTFEGISEVTGVSSGSEVISTVLPATLSTGAGLDPLVAAGMAGGVGEASVGGDGGVGAGASDGGAGVGAGWASACFRRSVSCSCSCETADSALMRASCSASNSCLALQHSTNPSHL